MPQVPGYNPVPQVQPFERPVPLPGVDAPPEAFGTGIARAVSTFGGDVAKAGDEVFSRAMALRQLQIEGKLRDMTTAYYNEVAPVQEQFLSAQGSNAGPDQLQDHVAQIDAINKKYAGQAEQYGPYGRNTFGADSAAATRQFMTRAISHSADQTRIAQDQSIDAQIATLRHQAGGAMNDVQLSAITDKIAALEVQRSALFGSSPDVTKEKTYAQVSGATTENVKSAILRDPENGAAIGQKALDGKNLTSEDADKVIRAAQDAVYKTGPHQYMNRLYSGQSTDLGSGKVSIDRLESAIWANEGHGRGPMIWNRNSAYYGQRALPGGVMPGNLRPWLKEAGMPPMTEEQYANDVNAQHQLMRFKLNQFQEQYGSANDAASVWFTGRPVAQAGLKVGDGYHTNTWYLRNFNAALAKSASQTDIANAAGRHGDSISTSITPDAGEQYREFATRKWDQQKSQENFNETQNLHTIDGSIGATNPDTGKLPVTREELFSMNAANKQAYDSLDDRTKEKVDQALANNARLIVPPSPERENLFRQMVGKFQDPETRGDAMNTVISGLDLTGPQKDKLNQIRSSILNKKEDTRIAPVMGQLQSTFGRAIPDKSKSPTAWQQFTGAAQLWIEDYFNRNKKPPTPDEVREFGRLMIKDTSAFGGYLGATPAYTQSVPREVLEYMQQKYPGMPPQEIHNIWLETEMMRQFTALHEKKQETAAK